MDFAKNLVGCVLRPINSEVIQRQHPHLLSLAKDVKLGLYTIPAANPTPGRHMAVYYTTAAPRQLHCQKFNQLEYTCLVHMLYTKKIGRLVQKLWHRQVYSHIWRSVGCILIEGHSRVKQKEYKSIHFKYHKYKVPKSNQLKHYRGSQVFFAKKFISLCSMYKAYAYKVSNELGHLFKSMFQKLLSRQSELDQLFKSMFQKLLCRQTFFWIQGLWICPWFKITQMTFKIFPRYVLYRSQIWKLMVIAFLAESWNKLETNFPRLIGVTKWDEYVLGRGMHGYIKVWVLLKSHR